ncbi:MAG: hypothetical protein P8166_16880, partial [Candidatus Thiodiazotropha sp.]
MSGLKYSPRSSSNRTAIGWILPLALLVCSSTFAGPREQAKRMHDRLTGVPPTAEKLDEMVTAINSNDFIGAARLAIEHPDFYNVTLKNWVTPWTNRERDAFAPLNDFTATVIGMIRDDKPFNTVLSADIVYIAPGVTPAYSNSSNAHYQQIEQLGLNLKDVLESRAQSDKTINHVPSEYAAAGVVTTRAA